MKNIDNAQREEPETEENTQTVSSLSLLLSVAVFAVVLSVTAYLFLENTNVTNRMEKANQEIAAYEEKIGELRANHDIIATELVNSNKADIDQAIVRSEAQKYISELIGISKKYKIQFSGFTFSDGKVSTSAVALSNPGEADAVDRFRSFISDMRSGSGSLLFQLEPVTAITGQEQKRNTTVEFSILPTKNLLSKTQ